MQSAIVVPSSLGRYSAIRTSESCSTFLSYLEGLTVCQLAQFCALLLVYGLSAIAENAYTILFTGWRLRCRTISRSTMRRWPWRLLSDAVPGILEMQHVMVESGSLPTSALKMVRRLMLP